MFYPNICTQLALKNIAWWLKHVEHHLPEGFSPHQIQFNIIEIIINNSIFIFDDTYLLQREGTATGTNTTTNYTDLYFFHHKINVLLIKYREELCIFRHYVDNGVLTWNNSNACDDHDWDNTPIWQSFPKDLKFQGLTFIHTNLLRSAIIMDAATTLSQGQSYLQRR